MSPISAALCAYNFIIAANKGKWGSVMTNSPAEMAKKQSAKLSEKPNAETAQAENSTSSGALHRRYHQIGISAVAAAVRYQGVAKNQAYAPASVNWRYFAELAAA